MPAAGKRLILDRVEYGGDRAANPQAPLFVSHVANGRLARAAG